jgi:ketosteroid isomerase-like protein
MALGETTSEAEIRALDAREAEAMLASDLTTLERLWSRELVVNAPDDKVKSRDEVLQAVREARIRYSSFQRNVERIVVRGDSVISMGSELVTPQGDRPDAGLDLTRRYTHIWQKRDGAWVLVARHANVTRTPTP